MSRLLVRTIARTPPPAFLFPNQRCQRPDRLSPAPLFSAGGRRRRLSSGRPLSCQSTSDPPGDPEFRAQSSLRGRRGLPLSVRANRLKERKLVRSATEKQGPTALPLVARFEVRLQARGGIYGWVPDGRKPLASNPSHAAPSSQPVPGGARITARRRDRIGGHRPSPRRRTGRRPSTPCSATCSARASPRPRPLGMDDQGRETCRWLPGRCRLRPGRPPAGRLAAPPGRRAPAAYHAAVAGFTPLPAIWRHGPQAVRRRRDRAARRLRPL